jgi:DNA adenine methylase
MYTKDKYTGAKLLKSPIKLIGAKTNNHGRDLIYQLAPPHVRYRELFMGSAGVLIGKSKVTSEAIGDIDTAAVNFFRQFQNHPKALFDKIMMEVGKIQSEPTGYYWKYMRDNEVEWSADPLTHASWYYCINKYAMNGIVRRNRSGKCNSSWCKTVKGRGIMSESWAKSVYLRIANVIFHNNDYKFLLTPYEDTFTLADPPYHDVKTIYSGVSFKEEDQRELKESLDWLKGKWMLTINDHPFIRELYEGYEMIEWRPFYSCSQTSAGRQRTPELIITNYPIKEKYETLCSSSK